MPIKHPAKVCAKESTIPGLGKGLFALSKIKSRSIIVEFKGKLLKPGSKAKGARSNIYFCDEYMLECPSNDLASFANDAINFTRERRYLMPALRSEEPFYTKHSNAKINAEIKINNNLHRAFLIACDDIEPGEEIFCHYGFTYWFWHEITEVGFLGDEEMTIKGFPKKIFKYPSFVSYLKNFYPKYAHHEVKSFKDCYDVIIHLNDGNKVLMMIQDYSKKINGIKLDPNTPLDAPTEELLDYVID